MAARKKKSLARRKGAAPKRRARRSTAAKAARRFKILQDTANLVNSITPDYGVDYWEAYTNVPYATYHVSKEPRRVIPLRDFFDIDQEKFLDDAVELLMSKIV